MILFDNDKKELLDRWGDSDYFWIQQRIAAEMIGAHIILYLISRRMPKRNDCGDSFTFDVFKQSRTQEGSYEKSVGLEGMAYLSTSLSLSRGFYLASNADIRK